MKLSQCIEEAVGNWGANSESLIVETSLLNGLAVLALHGVSVGIGDFVDLTR